MGNIFRLVDLYRQAKQEDPGITEEMVYASIQIFLKLGLIREIAPDRYEMTGLIREIAPDRYEMTGIQPEDLKR